MNIRIVLSCLILTACSPVLGDKGCGAHESATACDARQRAEVIASRPENQWRKNVEANTSAPTEAHSRPPAQGLTDEDMLYCQMQAQQTAAAADTGYGGMIYSAINAAASGAMVRDTCQRMRLAARQHR